MGSLPPGPFSRTPIYYEFLLQIFEIVATVCCVKSFSYTNIVTDQWIEHRRRKLFEIGHFV